MALTRTTTTLAQVIVKRLGDTGGVLRRDAESELDSIIAYINKYGTRDVFSGLFSLNPGVGTVTSTLTTIAANTLDRDGDNLDVVVFGRFVTSANNKEIRLNINQGGTNILCTTGVFTTGAPGLWEARAMIRRDTSANIDARASGILANTVYGQAEFFAGGTWNWGASFTVDIVTILATGGEVFIDRCLILKHPAQ